MELWEKYNRPLIPLPIGQDRADSRSGCWIRYNGRGQKKTILWNIQQKFSWIWRRLTEGCSCVFRKQAVWPGYMRMEKLLWSLGKESIWGRN